MSAKRRPHQKYKQNEKAENYDSDYGTREDPRKMLSDLEITNIHQKDCRLMRVKMIQDLGSKLEAKLINYKKH